MLVVVGFGIVFGVFVVNMFYGVLNVVLYV